MGVGGLFEGHLDAFDLNGVIYYLSIYHFFIHFVHTICFAVWVIYLVIYHLPPFKGLHHFDDIGAEVVIYGRKGISVRRTVTIDRSTEKVMHRVGDKELA